MNAGRANHVAVQYMNHVYVAGGINEVQGSRPGQPDRQILRDTGWSRLTDDRTLDIWQSGPDLRTPRSAAGGFVLDGRFFVLGGEGTTSVETSQIAANGSLGPWELAANMPSERGGFAVVLIGRLAYLIGGNDGKGSLASVIRVTIDDAGNLINWTTVARLTSARRVPAAVKAGGHIYVFGGHDGEATLRTVERSVVHPDGSLGAWEILPSPMLDRRQGATATVSDGRVVVIGGYSGAGPGRTPPSEYVATVESAALEANGNLGAWEDLTYGQMRSRRGYHATVTLGRQIYAIGGGDGSGFVPTIEKYDLVDRR